MTTELDELFPTDFLSRNDVKIAIAEFANDKKGLIAKLTKMHKSFVQSSDEYKKLNDKLVALQDKKRLGYNKHLKEKRGQLQELQLTIQQENQRIAEGERKMNTLRPEMIEKEKSRIERLRQKVNGLQAEEKKLDYTFPQESELNDIRRKLDELNKVTSPNVSPMSAKSGSLSQETPPSQVNNLSLPEVHCFPIAVPALPFVQSLQSQPSPIDMELNDYLSRQDEYTGSLPASPKSSSGPLDISHIAEGYNPVTVDVLQREKPSLFNSPLRFADPNVFSKTIKLNEYVTPELVRKLLQLKSKDVVMFQKACSLLSSIYKPSDDNNSSVPALPKSGAAFLERDSSSDDDSNEGSDEQVDLVKIRNLATVRCVEELL